MGTRWILKLGGRIAIAGIASLGWLAVSQLPARAQPPSMCIDETNFYLQNRITERAQWGRIALGNGHIQPAAEHLAEGLDGANTVEPRIRALILESFVEANSASTGWLIHDVDRLVELGETEAVRTVLTSAQLTAQGLPEGYSALKIRVLTTLAVDYAAIDESDTALELLAQARQLEARVQGAEFKTNALIAIAQGYGATGESALSAKVATQALQQANTVNYPDSVRRDRTLDAIAVLYAEAGELDRALQLTQTIEQPYFRENIIGSAALSAARLGRMDQATNLVQQLTLDQPTIRTIRDIGLHLASSGNKDQSQRYFDQLVRAIETYGYPGPSFTQTMVEAGFVDTVLTALRAAPEGRTKVDGLMDVASYHTQVGNTVAVRDVLLLATTATAEIKQDYAQRDLWEEILKRAIALKDYDLALATVETLVARDLTFNETEDYTKIAVAAARSGQIDVALAVSDRIDPSYQANRYRVWSEIAVAHAAAGDFDAAFAMAEKTKAPYGIHYAKTLVKIGLQQRQAGLAAESATTIDQAIQAAETLDYPSEQLTALNAIALEHAKIGLTTPAADLLEQIVTMLQEHISADDTFTLQTIASGWVEIEEYRFALQLIDAVPETQPYNPLWKTLVVEPLIAQENYAMALDIIKSRTTSDVGVDESIQIAERYLQVGQTKLGLEILAGVYGASETHTSQLLRVAQLYSHMGQTEQVLAVLDRAFAVAKTVPGEESNVIYIREDLVVDDTQDRGSLYEEIAIAYARAGAFERGRTVVQALQESATREQAMTRLNCYRDF